MSNRPPLEFHVPQPRTRPGENADFGHLSIPAAGATRRPDVGTTEQDARDMPFGLIRVLDESNAALGP